MEQVELFELICQNTGGVERVDSSKCLDMFNSIPKELITSDLVKKLIFEVRYSACDRLDECIADYGKFLTKKDASQILLKSIEDYDSIEILHKYANLDLDIDE